MNILINELPDLIIDYNTKCSQLHNYFDLDTNKERIWFIEYESDSEDLEPTNKITETKPPKPKAKATPKPKAKATPKPKKEKQESPAEISQEILNEFWNDLIDTELPTSLVSLTDSFSWFYKTPTAEAEMATLILNKTTELNTTYNVKLIRPPFWTTDNQPSTSSFQSWQPDWQTVKSDTFWNTKYPPLKKTKMKKMK